MRLPDVWGFHFHRARCPFEGASPVEIEILLRLDRLLKLNQRMETEIMIDFTKVLADMEAQDTVLASLVPFVNSQKQANADQAALIKQLQDQITALGNADPAIQQTLDALAAHVENNNNTINGLIPAVAENTQTPPAQLQQATEQTAADPQPSSDPVAAAPAAQADAGAAQTDSQAAAQT